MVIEKQEANKYHHLLAQKVRMQAVNEAFGSWRKLGYPQAVPLHIGYPYPESYLLDRLIESVRKTFDEDGPEALKYGGGNLAKKLEQLLIDRCNTRGLKVGPENLIITNGSMQGISFVCDLFLDCDDVMLIEAPTFMGALRCFKNFGVQLQTVELQEDGPDLDELEEKLQNWQSAGQKIPKLFYTIPNFHNPRGSTMSLSKRHRLLEMAHTYDFIIVEDDAYGELRYEGEDILPLRALDNYGRVIHLGSMSKILAPGVRIGWAIGPAPLIQATQANKTDGGTNPFAQAVVAKYWSLVDIDERLNDLRQGYRERRDAALRALEAHMPQGCSWSYPEGGYFIWVTLPEGMIASELLPKMGEEGGMPLAGNMFFPQGRGSNNLRISFSYPQPQVISQGVEAIARVVARHI